MAAFRPRCDYHSLNAIKRPDHYTIPHLHDFTHQLAGCQIFSTLDLVRAYHHIPIEESDNEFKPFLISTDKYS
ncbi:hypothetical protein TNCV_1368091 [Trichonephila clavipes]|nr:hypothetical protein TNCV_1368091 [Trichonephila clavipes]